MASPSLRIRSAVEADVSLLVRFIRELAEYEQLLHECQADEGLLGQWLFGEMPRAYAVVAEWEGEAAGFALYFYNFSTFLTRPGIYIEDVYVSPKFRRKGIGKEIFTFLARRALEEGCGRLEWWVLDWNTPAIDFYRSIGAVPMSEWTVQRVSGDALWQLAGALVKDTALI